MHIGSFLWKDIIRRPGELFFILLGIAFGIAATFILFSLRFGIEKTLFTAAVSKNPLSEITLYGSPGNALLKVLGGGKEKTLTQETIQEIEKAPLVKKVTPHLIYKNLASVEINILGNTIQTDSLIFGAPGEVVQNDLPADMKWQVPENPDTPLPVIVSRKLIDLYNLSIASGTGLPLLEEKTFIGSSIKIFPGFSSFLNRGKDPSLALHGKIVGFSDRVDLIGITLPIEKVRMLNSAEGTQTETYNKLFVTLESSRAVPQATEFFEKQGFRVTSLQKEFTDVSRSLNFIEIILFILTGIILAIAIILIANTFWTSLFKRRKELGILRAIGAKRTHLLGIFLSEAIFIGLLGGVLGIFIGYLSTILFQSLLSEAFRFSSLALSTVFDHSRKLTLALLIISPLLAGVASIFPIIKTVYQPPRSLFIQ